MATSKPASGSGNPFWDYSLALYARPGVAAACLGLQERRGLDVNLLLFCCWAGGHGHELTSGDWRSATAAVAEWHGQVVVPLRGVRRWLKGREATVPGAGELRQRITAQELDAERMEQDLLHAALPLAEGAPSAVAAAANLGAYLWSQGKAPDSDDSRDLATILAQAFPQQFQGQLT